MAEEGLPPVLRRLSHASLDKKSLKEVSEPDGVDGETVRFAVEYISKNQDYRSYHMLMLIRSKDLMTYKRLPSRMRAAVLASALANTVFLNDWGYLLPEGRSQDGEAALALLELGRDGLDAVGPILSDMSDAPLFGSMAATIGDLYKYRRADYAYRYCALLTNKKPVFHERLADRDKDLAELRRSLEQGKTGEAAR